MVVRWEWIGDHAAVDQPVAAIIRPQVSTCQVIVRIVEVLHAARMHSPDEVLSMIRPKGHKRYPARLDDVRFDPGDGRPVKVPWGGMVWCGPDPYLVARLACVWPRDDGGINWEDEPRPDPTQA